MVATSPSAVADTTQNNGCLGVTGTFSTFAVPITGTATPSSVVLPNTVTLSGVGVTIQVAASLIAAGVNTGIVSAADSVADLGVPSKGTTSASGINAVVAAPGAVTLNITATNATPALQTVTNSAPANTTFWVTTTNIVKPSTGVTTVYDKILTGSTPVVGNAADASRTAEVLVGNLSVAIPLDATTATPPASGAIVPGDTVWTPTSAGTITFAEQNTAPATLLTTVGPPVTGPSTTDQNAAPLQLFPKINGAVNAPFICWPGTTTADTPATGDTALVPAGSTAISSATVTAPATPPVCQSPQSVAVGGHQTAAPVVPQCTDVNPTQFTPSNTSISLVGTNGGATHASSVTVQANGSIVYANNGDGANTDSFQYTATGNDIATPSNTVTVNVTVLNNSCTTGSDTAALTPNADGPEPEIGTDANGCSLKQVLIVPIAPSTLKMDQAGNQDILGCQLSNVLSPTPTCVNDVAHGQPPTLTGASMYLGGRLSEVTVTNARGTDDGWTLTGQVSDFVDGTRSGLAAICSAPATTNITQTPPNNHCIPGGNLGWQPSAAIVDLSVPGDTAAVTPGSAVLPPIPGITIPSTVTRPSANLPGLHDAAHVLCFAPDNQAGGTFTCDAGLAVAVPGSAAAGNYAAILTLTLA